jgi:hypothetical protein
MPDVTNAHEVGYHGPPRRPEDVVARALANPELMRQLDDSLDAQRRGVPAVPFREVQEEAKRRDAARERASRSA